LEKVDPQLKFSVSSKKRGLVIASSLLPKWIFFCEKRNDFTEKNNGLIETS